MLSIHFSIKYPETQQVKPSGVCVCVCCDSFHIRICLSQYEAVPESLKNMLLVMDSAGVFTSCEGHSPLWDLTWERINTFLPNLRDELFKAHASGKGCVYVLMNTFILL